MLFSNLKSVMITLHYVKAMWSCCRSRQHTLTITSSAPHVHHSFPEFKVNIWNKLLISTWLGYETRQWLIVCTKSGLPRGSLPFSNEPFSDRSQWRNLLGWQSCLWVGRAGHGPCTSWDHWPPHSSGRGSLEVREFSHWETCSLLTKNKILPFFLKSIFQNHLQLCTLQTFSHKI